MKKSPVVVILIALAAWWWLWQRRFPLGSVATAPAPSPSPSPVPASNAPVPGASGGVPLPSPGDLASAVGPTTLVYVDAPGSPGGGYLATGEDVARRAFQREVGDPAAFADAPRPSSDPIWIKPPAPLDWVRPDDEPPPPDAWRDVLATDYVTGRAATL